MKYGNNQCSMKHFNNETDTRIQFSEQKDI